MALLEARFLEDDAPPNLPDFALEMTTIYVSRDSGWKLGNEVLSFFAGEKESAATLRKLRRAKFAITIDVEVWALATIKTRIYAARNGMYAIEMQRRSGDSVTFIHIFRKIARFLRGRLDEPDLGEIFDPATATLALYDP